MSRAGGIAAVALATALLPSAAAAQTGVRGVPADRPDQRTPAPQRAERAPAGLPLARQPDAPVPPFVLDQVFVEGSTLPEAALAAAWRPFVGQTMDGKALAALTDAVAAAYKKSDVALYTVYVPEQKFIGGALRLVAVEGYVNAVEVRGKLRAHPLKLIRAYLRRLERERPLTTSTFQRIVSLIRDMPGLNPEVSLQPGAAQGAVKLVVVAHEKPVQLSAGLNDRGTALLGRTQFQVDAYLNAPFAGADQLRLSVLAPTKVSRFQYVAGAYTLPVDADGTAITGNLSYLRTRPAAFPLKGDAVSFGLQVSRPLIRSYTDNLSLTFGVDGINSNNALLGFILSNDRVRAARLGLSFSTATARNAFGASATASVGLDVLGARIAPGQARQGFRKLTVKLNDSVQLGKSVVLRLNGVGQATGDDLPSSELLALGGDEFGRAYESALIAGDTGYAGSAELAWVPRKLPKLVEGTEFYTFVDGGRVRYRSRFGLPSTSSHLGSVGGGVRFRLAARSVIQVEAVRGLTNPVFYEDRKKTRVLFSIRTLL